MDILKMVFGALYLGLGCFAVILMLMLFFRLIGKVADFLFPWKVEDEEDRGSGNHEG